MLSSRLDRILQTRPDVVEACAEARKQKYINELDQRILYLQKARAEAADAPALPIRNKDCKNASRVMNACNLSLEELTYVVETHLAKHPDPPMRPKVGLSAFFTGLGRIGDALTPI